MKTEGGRPWAVIQLRAENVDRTMFSMVGFQTKMKWPEQKEFSLHFRIEKRILRLGSIHEIHITGSLRFFAADLSLKGNNRVFLAGQITGVEGYTESSAIGLLLEDLQLRSFLHRR